MLFGGDGEGLVFEGDLDIVFLVAWEVGLDIDMVGILADIDGVGGESLGAIGLGTEKTAENRIELTVHGFEGVNAH